MLRRRQLWDSQRSAWAQVVDVADVVAWLKAEAVSRDDRAQARREEEAHNAAEEAEIEATVCQELADDIESGRAL